MDYTYRAFVTGVYDGDSITADVDLGFHTSIKGVKFRLANIDTPEIRGEEREQGLISKAAVVERILNKWVIIKTEKDKKGKYGRYLATVYIDDLNLNEWLLQEGLAKSY
jgi:micrococcal nuclease